MTQNTYRTEIGLAATVFIRADTPAAAADQLRALIMNTLTVPSAPVVSDSIRMLPTLVVGKHPAHLLEDVTWDHVDHKITREVLTQLSIDEDSICQALTFANQCLQADQHNEDVKHEWYAARASALDDAEVSWNELGDTLETIEDLRRFWSV